MKVLIIDDSDYKIRHLKAFLEELNIASELEVARSFQSGIHRLKEFVPDLVLLDMSLPTSERPGGELEGRSRIYGGREVLAEMEFYELKSKVIVVSQFDRFGEPPNSVTLDTLLAQLKRMFPLLFVGGVYYSNVDSLWRDKLRTQIEAAFPRKI